MRRLAVDSINEMDEVVMRLDGVLSNHRVMDHLTGPQAVQFQRRVSDWLAVMVDANREAGGLMYARHRQSPKVNGRASG